MRLFPLYLKLDPSYWPAAERYYRWPLASLLLANMDTRSDLWDLMDGEVQPC